MRSSSLKDVLNKLNICRAYHNKICAFFVPITTTASYIHYNLLVATNENVI
jgi:hypothetical protein